MADLWAARTDRSTGALSSVVTNNGRSLERLRDPANSVTDATLEKFARFLVDPANWPDGSVPQEAVDLAHRVGVTPDGASLSPGIADDLSREELAA